MTRRRAGARARLFASALGVAGCAVHPTSDVAAFAEGTGANSFEAFGARLDSPDALVLPVEHDRQTAGPSCGAHVLASVVNYWLGSGTLRGEALFGAAPPADPSGYSMAELLVLARAHGLLASAVRLPPDGLIAELERGRPVLTPVRLPSIYVQQRTLPGSGAPGVDVVTDALVNSTGRASELTSLALVDHYLLVIGYEEDTFVVLEPVMGYRTIAASTLARYREPFGDAAMVFSAASAAQ